MKKAFKISFNKFAYNLAHPKETLLKTKIWCVRTYKKIMFYLKTPRLLYHTLRHGWKYIISFMIAWFITNGWAYVLAITGNKIAIAYITLLWFPGTPEKMITIPLSLIIHKVIWFEKHIINSNKIQLDLALIGE